MMDTITFENNRVNVTIPEGLKASMPIVQFFQKISPQKLDTGDLILPDGVKCMIARGPYVVMVHQTPPRVFNFKWIANDSKIKHGPGTTYRTVRIAQPYIIVLAVFRFNKSGHFRLTGYNECFYRVNPLSSLENELLYPALLNCSKFANEKLHPLSWICTQYLRREKLKAVSEVNSFIHRALRELLQILFETGFNYSSEHHELSSWFTESRGVDDRISTVEEWEKATEENPLFVLDVPWLKTGRTVQEVIERIFRNRNIGKCGITTTSDITRIIFNG